MKIRRKQRRMRTHAIPWAFAFAAVFLCLAAFAGVHGTLRVMEGWTNDLPSIDDTDFTSHAQESVMYASDGETLLAQFQLEKRDPVTSDQVSAYAKQATVDTEDERFYDHPGVDLAGIARALVNNVLGGQLEGASTITQQLVRNTVLTQEANEISIERKVREAELAVEMENRYSKDEILLMYLNTINYGDGCYGIEAAAQNYFQVSAADLTLAQAATLAGIPQSPTYLNPKEYPDAALARRNLVLSRMCSNGDITVEERDAAQAEELNLNPAPDAPEDGIYAYPYFTRYVRDLLLAENNPFGCSYADLFEGGLTVYTSLDPAMQDAAETACANQRARMDGSLDAALVAVDATNGQVKALVGGSGDSKVNLATGTGGSGRQAGSTFKAFTLAAAIEQGVDPNTRIDCTSPMKIGEDGATEEWENFGNIDYGIRTIARATEVSSNTGYLRLSNAIGQQATTDMAHRLGVTSSVSTVYNTTLGTADVTPLEMASSYATLATGGVKHDPVVVTKIVDRDGTTIYEAPDTSERVLAEDVAGATTKVLRGVFDDDEGTAHGAAPANGQPVAGKTGTSSFFADYWLVGYTPTLSCAAWIGNPAGTISMPESMDADALWKEFMDVACALQPVTAFPETKDPAYNNAFNASQKAKLGEEPKDVKKAATDADEDKAKAAADSEDGENAEAAETEDDKDEEAPNVVGHTLQEAAVLLAGHDAGYLEEHSDTVPAGTVISQRVDEGKIVLVVSLGPA